MSKHALIKSPAIMRLAKRGGAFRLASDVYEPARDLLEDTVRNVVTKAVAYTKYLGRTVCGVNQMVAALPIKLFAADPPKDKYRGKQRPDAGVAKRKSAPNKAARRDVRHYQKASGCLFSSRSGFSHRARKLAGNHVRFSPSALLHLQYFCEQMLSAVFNAAKRLTEHRHHQSVDAKDFNLAVAVCSSLYKYHGCNVGGVGAVRFNAYIKKIGGKGMRKSKNYLSQLSQFLNRLCHRLACDANFATSAELRRGRKARRHAQPKKTLGSAEVKLAIDNMYLGHGGSAAGLPAAVVMRFLRNQSAPRVSEKAATLMAGVIARLIHNVDSLATAAAKEKKQVTLNSRHLAMVFNNDLGLHRLAKECGWDVLGGDIGHLSFA
jgi:histone H3/H4